MRKCLGLLLILAVAIPTVAGTYDRIMKLRDCDKIVIKQKRKDDVTVTGSSRVKEFASMLTMEIDNNNHQAGEPTFRLEFYRGTSQKPVDVVWVATNGNWGLTGIKEPLAKNQKVLNWVKEAIKR